ncbi:MAG: hypothetical protein RQ741_06800 [Wenzhouxiangellaceae bacterium]|nr:hypothetical protein [Wenzhouxiangellaceae bacterium]
MKPKPDTKPKLGLAALLGASLAGLVLVSGCSANPLLINNEAPGLELESLELENSVASARLLVHNRNDETLFIESASLSLELEDSELFSDSWPLRLDIGSRGRENVRLQSRASDRGAARLGALDRGEAASVAYRLLGELVLSNQSNVKVEQRGFLHPVPGQPGRYR